MDYDTFGMQCDYIRKIVSENQLSIDVVVVTF